MLGKHHHHHGGGGGWWGGYGPGWWGPGYEVGPLYVGSLATQSCGWYQDQKTDASGATYCQTPATWLIVAGAAAALLAFFGLRK